MLLFVSFHYYFSKNTSVRIRNKIMLIKLALLLGLFSCSNGHETQSPLNFIEAITRLNQNIEYHKGIRLGQFHNMTNFNFDQFMQKTLSTIEDASGNITQACLSELFTLLKALEKSEYWSLKGTLL